jgi:hypothetical protein
MPRTTPGENGKWFKNVVASWRSLKPQKKFLGLTVDEFEAELKPCHDVRDEITSLNNKLTGARNQRDESDVKGLDLVTRLVNAIRADETEGEDSELLEAIGYTIPSKRKSGLHRNPPQQPVESLPKAA